MEKITFYHNPMSRGQIVHWMLEEVGATYETHLLDFNKREHKEPSYLEINPMGKVPTIVFGNTAITECAAICTFLADIFPEKKLAPRIDDPARGTYLRWMFFAAGCIEPALSDKAFPRTTTRSSALGYGSYEDTLAGIEYALRSGPFLLGNQFSAADLYLASQMNYGMLFKTMEERPGFAAYVNRCTARPAYKRQQDQSKTFEEQLKNRSK